MSILYTNDRMADIFKDPPMVAFKPPRNLKDMVARGRFGNTLLSGGFKTCSDTRCLLCKFRFISLITGRIYKILGNASCHTDKLIFHISCRVCSKQYVVETCDLQRRINNYFSTIKIKKRSRSLLGSILICDHK